MFIWKDEGLVREAEVDLISCRIGSVVAEGYQTLWKARLYERNDKVSCNYVKEKETRVRHNSVHQYFGEYSPRFVEVEENLVQSGIWDFNHRIEDYFIQLPILRANELRENTEKEPVVFTMDDWKIISIFVVWAVLLLGAIFVFLVEGLYAQKSDICTQFGKRVKLSLETRLSCTSSVTSPNVQISTGCIRLFKNASVFWIKNISKH